ncbi:hypothetical protein [Butyrivibrio sp. JL13D10]|uniref:glycosyltransferase family 39 protein n=1 Tax=Butyrivibrio sp. JL13D10 TaxID=3236815 RepID=UPI0038B5ABED
MRKEDNKGKFRTAENICGVLMYLISAAMLIFSGYLCFSPDIWYDELFSIQFALKPISEMVKLTAADVHPPLYYIIVHVFMRAFSTIGNLVGIDGAAAGACTSGPLPVVYAKVASVIPLLILFIYGITVIRKCYGAFIGGLFSCAMIAMPQMADYSVEVRMYSWVMFFITALCIHAKPFIQPDKEKQVKGLRFGKMFPIFIYGLLACYTQYYAAVAVAAVYLFLIVWSVRKNIYQLGIILISANLTVVCYIPWIGVVLSQAKSVSSNYWIQPLSLRSFGGIIKYLMKPGFFNEKLATVLAVLMFALVAFVVLANLRDAYMWLCFMPLIGIIAFGFAASYLLRPIFTYRYMIPGMGALWLGVLVGAVTGVNKKNGENLKKSLSENNGENLKKSLNENNGENLKKSLAENDGENLKKSLSENNIGNINKFFSERLVKGAQAWGFLLLSALMIVFGIRDFWAFRGNELYKRVNMEKVVELLSDDYENTVIICNFDQVSALSLYYFNEMSDITLENGKAAQVPVYLYGAMTDAYLETIIPGIGVIDKPADVRQLINSGKRVLFLGSFNSREDIVREWKETEGIDNENTGSYLLERYWIDVFELS